MQDTTYDRRRDIDLLFTAGDEPNTVPKTGTEVKYQFIDRMLNYGVKSLDTSAMGMAYHRLLYDSIMSINPVSESTYLFVSGVINTVVIRLADDDYYNARLLLEGAIRIMRTEATL